ncbi:GGDEF domain-containing protein [Spirulina subsalsa FACHB-351]|uniref:GGDEF domain-containing protein n=1 Tax=Spirulina subsalsa FACHB-351 TaxID=234711 RepID=A0ABT3L779_9CYAN|nr:GGDEF domain-containing protein [Spirulina subsalsa]MCW6037378.1 GGDEF domain-containing protein [Spirulina subsalsa FACHB-351]
MEFQSFIDPKTLILFTVFSYILKGILLKLAFNIRHKLFLKYLSLASFSFALGWLLFFLRFFIGINILSLSIANVFILLFPMLLICSIYSIKEESITPLYFKVNCFVLSLTFVVLTTKMNDQLLPGFYTSIFNGLYYGYAGFILLNHHPKKLVLSIITTLNLFISLILILRGCILMIGYLYPDIITANVISILLSFTLFFNLFCIDAQILCFPILDFIKTQGELEEVNIKLNEISQKDELTGIFNRRAFTEKLEQEKNKNPPTLLAIILFDLDYFKQINDQFGHDVGDLVLIQVAKIVQQGVRSHDMVVRYGGEEFVVVLSNTDWTEALAIAEKLRIAIATFPFSQENMTLPEQVTASFGVAVASSTNLSIDNLLKQADLALYRAKQQGRNQVCT